MVCAAHSGYADFTRYAPEEGYLSLRGQESLCSENRVSLLARKLTSVYATLTACMDFQPEVFQHSAGLVLYYDKHELSVPAENL